MTTSAAMKRVLAMARVHGAIEAAQIARNLRRQTSETIWIGWKRPSLKRLRPANTSDYLMKHGTLYRAEPKRDKSISARQWKKREKALRRAALIAG